MSRIRKFISFISSQSYSLKKRMTITSFLLVFFPLIFIGVYGYYIYTSHMENITSRLSKQIILPLKQQVEQTFKQLDESITPIWLQDELQQLVNTPSDQWIDHPRQIINIKKNIKDVIGWQPAIRGLFIVSSDGGVLYDIVASQVDYNYRFEDEDFFHQSKEGKTTFVSGPSEQKYIKGDLVFSITRSLRSIPSYQWHGAIHVDIDADKILSYFKPIHIGKSGYVAAYNSEGRFVYHPDSTMIGKKVDYPYYSRIENEPDNGSFYMIHDEINHFVTFDKSEYLDWTFVGIVPKNEMNQGAFEIRNAVLYTGLGSLLVILIILWRINHIALQPIYQINNAIRDLGLGDFSSKLKKSRLIELQPVVTQYNRTVDQLKVLTETLTTTKIKQHQTEILAQKNQLLKQEAELRQREAELGQLEAQINPHFLYNTLSSIQSLAELEETHKVDRVVGLLSKLLRYSLSQYIAKVKIKEELEHVNVFVEIQQIRHENDIEVFWDIDPAVLDYDINRLSIQPLVENAYFHGVEPFIGDGKIYITIKKENAKDRNLLYICVEDNGCGMDEDKLKGLNQFIYDQTLQTTNLNEPSKRLSGIYNVIRRLKLVYGKNCRINIDSRRNKGTKIEIYLSLEEEIA